MFPVTNGSLFGAHPNKINKVKAQNHNLFMKTPPKFKESPQLLLHAFIDAFYERQVVGNFWK